MKGYNEIREYKKQEPTYNEGLRFLGKRLAYREQLTNIGIMNHAFGMECYYIGIYCVKVFTGKELLELFSKSEIVREYNTISLSNNTHTQ